MPKILYLVHGLPPEEYTGTPLVAYGYATAVAERGWEATVVYASPGNADASDPRRARAPGERFFRVAVPPTPYLGSYWSIEAPSAPRRPEGPVASAFRRLLRSIAPDLVHVVDNVHLPLDWPEIAAAAGIPVVRTVSCAEDLCGLVAPVSPCSGPAGYCAAPITVEHCADCIAALLPGEWGPLPERTMPGAGDGPGSSIGAQRRAVLLGKLRAKRARARGQFRALFDRIVFSTPGWRAYFEATLPLDPRRVRVIEMGIDTARWGTRERPPRDGPVVFCLAATFDRAKGQSAVVEAFSAPPMLSRDDYRLRLYGGGEVEVVAPLLACNPRVECVGPYRYEELPGILADADVGLSTSRFETFHRVTREYLLAGLPVIANRAAGFGMVDVIRDGENGIVYDHGEPASLLRAVTSVLDDPALRARLTAGARATMVRSLDDEVDELIELYEEVLEERAATTVAHREAGTVR